MKNRDQRPVIDLKGAPAYFQEAFRTMRTRVEKICEEKGYKTIMVTSAMPSEGKSTVAVNLALALAHKEKQVCLVDCDLRNPSVADLLALDYKNLGISGYLQGRIQIFNALTPYHKTSHLTVIPGGESVSNTGELLNSERFQELVRFFIFQGHFYTLTHT